MAMKPDVFAAMIEAGRDAAQDLGGADEEIRPSLMRGRQRQRGPRGASRESRCARLRWPRAATRGGCEAAVDMVAQGRAAFTGENPPGMDCGRQVGVSYLRMTEFLELTRRGAQKP